MNRISFLVISWPRSPRSVVSASRNGSIRSQPSERVARSCAATCASASASACLAAASSATTFSYSSRISLAVLLTSPIAVFRSPASVWPSQ
jgi:hypothetical protein